jgi:hypothetical protein
MLMIPKGYEKAAPGAMPDAKAVAAMLIGMLDMIRRAAVNCRWFEKERRQWAYSTPMHGSSNGRRF